jgi:MFS transporter, FHS family, L-fucose permease
MTTRKIYLFSIIPVLFSFFVMSFADLVGIGVDNAKADFQISNALAQLIPMAVFIWFFLLSLPVGIIQDRIGKRNMVNIGMLITAAGLMIPFFFYSFPMLLGGFALLGIGNTVLQVSANPLLIDVVPEERSASFLSFSQFIKSIGSMVAPFLASFFALSTGNWKIVLLVFGIFSILSAVWLNFVKLEETFSSEEKATFSSALRLLKTPYILLMVLGIFFVVGVDVGINSTSGQFLMERMGMDVEPAKQGRSLYFFGKMLGTFMGALLLTRLNPRKFLLFSAIATLIMILAFIGSPGIGWALTTIFLIGMAASNIFPVIFSVTTNKYKTRANEIAGLMIMAVSGGAFIPPVAGKLTDLYSITTGVFVLVLCAAYLVFVAVYTLWENSRPK